ncbi:hypothetical protein LIER_05315 [Lithospermum erythrorhizon]|uniref:Reverse transcriptase zinc-binding domain-containing protein n=1 Tax=Lithospermum erythrorhizon TaxID=34254 RepID=A0AAV3P458_LITER
MWMLCNDKMQTKDKLCVVEDSRCIFCGENENANHLFFACTFSVGIWRKLSMYLKDFHCLESGIKSCRGWFKMV